MEYRNQPYFKASPHRYGGSHLQERETVMLIMMLIFTVIIVSCVCGYRRARNEERRAMHVDTKPIMYTPVMRDAYMRDMREEMH